MSKREKTKAELLAENKELRRTKLTLAITEILVTLIKSAAVVICFYFFTAALNNLSGKTTTANIIVDFLGSISISDIVGIVFGAGGVIYGMIERRQRQKMIERLHGRVKKMEQKIDPKRSSSNITAFGDTHPDDY